MKLRKIAAALAMVLVVAITIAAVSNPEKIGLFYSSDGTGNPGTWVALSGSGTPYTGTVNPTGMFVSSDGTGNPGTWVAATAATFGGISGQTIGYLPKATSAGGSTTSSAIDDGLTAGFVTIHNEKLQDLVNANETYSVGGGCGAFLASVCYLNNLNNSSAQSILGLAGGAYNANTGIYYAAFNPTLISYWGTGILAADVNVSFVVKDKTSNANVLSFPNNTMPANSITGNAAGPIFSAVQTAAARKGTFVCTAGGTIVVANANEKTTSDVVISLNTVGGTPLAPSMKAIVNNTSFSVLCGASDTSTYNYTVLN